MCYAIHYTSEQINFISIYCRILHITKNELIKTKRKLNGKRQIHGNVDINDSNANKFE